MKPTVVVLAAGMGSRYGGVKQIDSVGLHGETLLDFGIYDAKESGFGKVVFIIRRDIEQDFRERLFDRIARNMDATYVFQDIDSLLTAEQATKQQRQKPWGTIHALLCAEPEVNTPFLVLNSDDYYGRKAFQTIVKPLSTEANDSTEHCMVGYVLENTMSLQGSVSRGLCTVDKDGYLSSMVENTQIEFVDGKPVSHFWGKDIPLTGKEWVSMNFFGFTPKAFEHFHGYWERFLEKNLASPKTECLLPNGASEIVTSGEGRIKMYTTDEKWFGMTYSADREIVRTELRKKIEQKYYPSRLWEK